MAVHFALCSGLTEWRNSEKITPLHVKNGNQKRKPVTSTDIYQGSLNKRLAHKPEKEVDTTLLGPFTKQHPDELLKEEGRISITKRNRPKRIINNLGDTFLCTHSRQSAPDLSTNFERLSADAVSPNG